MRVISRWKPWAPVIWWLLLGAPFAAAQQPKTAQSSAKDRTSLGITIYNSNFALVRETRRVNLPTGAVRLNFEGVPGSIEASTVYLRPVGGVDVLDQSYEYDLLNAQRLLEKYVGKEMTLVFREMQGGTTHYSEVKAILLSTNGPVWKIGDEIVTGMRPDGYRFPELPGELYNRPTLVWMLKDASAGERSLDVSYLADHMNWKADYVLNLGREGAKGSLEGWGTLTNDSCASFDDAQLSLVAGKVHRAVTPPRPMPMMARAENGVVGGVAPQFTQEAAGEYHLYTLNRQHLAAPAIELLADLRAEFQRRLRDEVAGWQVAPIHLSIFGSAARGAGDVADEHADEEPLGRPGVDDVVGRRLDHRFLPLGHG